MKARDLHDRNLIERVACSRIDNPSIAFLLITIIVIDEEVLDRRTGCRFDNVNEDGAGGVIGQGNDIEAGALEGEGCVRP